MLKRVLTTLALGALGGVAVYSAYIVFLLPGGLRAYFEKRNDFRQLYVYKVGESFIDIDFQGTDGQLVRLSQLPHKVVVVNFFVNGSRACDAEAPRLEQAWRKYGDRGLLVVGVDVNASVDKAREFAQLHHLTYPSLLVANRVEGGYTIPFNLVIDQKGVVRYSGDGVAPLSLENAIAGLMGRGDAAP